MEFIERLEETWESRKSRQELNQSYADMGRGMPAFQFRMLTGFANKEGYYLSVQASDGHYCTPRAFLPLGAYSEMEMAIRNPEGDFVRVSDVTTNKEIIESFSDYEGDSVYGYIPVEMIEALYQDAFKQEDEQ